MLWTPIAKLKVGQGGTRAKGPANCQSLACEQLSFRGSREKSSERSTRKERECKGGKRKGELASTYPTMASLTNVWNALTQYSSYELKIQLLLLKEVSIFGDGNKANTITLHFFMIESFTKRCLIFLTSCWTRLMLCDKNTCIQQYS